jgi:hypothetical protein
MWYRRTCAAVANREKTSVSKLWLSGDKLAKTTVTCIDAMGALAV